jgi:hypothetical protein
MRVAAVYLYLYPEADPIGFTVFIAERLGTTAGLQPSTMFERSDPRALTLSDQGYIAGVHPLELWLVGFLQDQPEASYADAEAASRNERQEVYGWLFNTRHRSARDVRNRTMLEVEEACCRLQGGSFRVHECPSEEGQMLSQQPEGHHHNHSTLPQQHIGCTPLLHLDPGGIQLASSNAAACSQFSMPASACEQIQQRIGTLLILDLVSSH